LPCSVELGVWLAFAELSGVVLLGCCAVALEDEDEGYWLDDDEDSVELLDVELPGVLLLILEATAGVVVVVVVVVM
jgi:hypothetical protein